MAIDIAIRRIMDPSMSAMDLLYPRNLKNISNWRKSEYLLVMYDAEKEQKKLLLAVSTHATKKIMTGASILFFTGTAFLFLVIATNFWVRVWINILTASWAFIHLIFHFYFS
jgi:hypothetical protein